MIDATFTAEQELWGLTQGRLELLALHAGLSVQLCVLSVELYCCFW